MTDLTLQTLIEFRGEMGDFRDETRKTLSQHGHRLNLLSEQMRDVAARMEAVETKLADLP